jgi:hypothetical protein
MKESRVMTVCKDVSSKELYDMSINILHWASATGAHDEALIQFVLLPVAACHCCCTVSSKQDETQQCMAWLWCAQLRSVWGGLYALNCGRREPQC